MKIGLGTVQFGIDYGISNISGKTRSPEVGRILSLARENGVRLIDTASMYGDSEEVMGRFLEPGTDFNIVTKTPAFKTPMISREQASQLVDSFHQSLEGLGQESLCGLLAHHAADLLKEGGELLLEAMEALKFEGLLRKIGVSVYTGEEIDRVLDLFTPDIVQLPLNVFDQRLIHSGHLRRLKQLGVEIHARSIFLQGLLLMDPDDTPAYFNPVRSHLIRYSTWLVQNNFNRLDAAIQFGIQQEELGIVLVGVCSAEQLKGVLHSLEHPLPMKLDFSQWAIEDERYINPVLWEVKE